MEFNVPGRTGSIYRGVYFHHIGKTGGTTLDSFLSAQFSERRVYPYHGATTKLLSQRYQYISGHMPWQTRHLLETPNIAVTVLRDPIETFLSMFRHLQRQPNHIFTLTATNLQPGFTLDEFLQDAGVRRYFVNPQTMSLARRFEWMRFHELCLACKRPHWRETTSVNEPGFVLLYGDSDEDRSTEERLSEAIATLTQAPTICTTTERLDTDLELIVRICTGRYPRGEILRKNVAPTETMSVTQSQRQQIKRMTSLDWQLYQYVTGRRSFENVGPT